MKYLNRKYQQGGAAPSGDQQVTQQIAQALQQGAKPEEVLQALVKQGMPQDQATQMIQGIIQQMQGTPSAKQGGKLEYIQRLQKGGIVKAGGGTPLMMRGVSSFAPTLNREQ